MPKVKMTAKFLEQELVCPVGKKRIEFVDSDFPALYLEVRASNQGQGTWYYRYADSHQKMRHANLGRTTDISLMDVRLKAKTLKAEIALGADPHAAEEARRAVITFDEFFNDHYLPYVKPRKRSWVRDEQLYRIRIQPKFGHKRLNMLTRQDIQSFHASLLGHKLASASVDLHLKFIKHALALAVDWGLLEKNPALRIPLFMKDNRVEHYLDEDELARLVTKLKTDPCQSACNILLFLLSTGLRLNEALQARWAFVDIENATLRISATVSKSKRMRTIPLNATALEVINSLDTQGEFEYLFINRQTGKPFVTINKVWMRIRKEIGLPKLRIHDLRHGFASLLINSGRTLYEVQQILGHSTPLVTTRYAHLSNKSLQDAANTASALIEKAVLSAA